MRSPISRTAAAAAVFVLIVSGVALWFHGGGAAVSFADVVEKFFEVKSYKMKMTDTIGDEIVRTADSIWSAPDRSRLEYKTKDGVERVMIEELNAKRLKTTHLIPAEKQAETMEWVDFDAREPFFGEAHGLMLKARDKKLEAVPLGEKVIDDRKAVGYRLKFEKFDTQQDIWADVETLLPVRIEITTIYPAETKDASPAGSKDKISGKIVHRSIWSDIQYNLKLDESLFDLNPPAGYKVVKHKPVVLSKEEEKPAAESKGSKPLNFGTLNMEGEVEEEGEAKAKK